MQHSVMVLTQLFSLTMQMHNSTCTSACKLMSKINFITPITCEEQSFYEKRCFNPHCLNGLDLGRDETGALLVHGVLGTSIKAKNTMALAEHISLNSDTYCTQQTIFLMQKPCQLWFLKESKLHKSQSCDGGKGQHSQIPWNHTLQEVKIMQITAWGITKDSCERNILPRILRVHLWSNSFQISVILVDIIKREPNRLQSSESSSKERKVQAPKNLSWSNYQSNLILVQNYILLH